MPLLTKTLSLSMIKSLHCMTYDIFSLYMGSLPEPTGTPILSMPICLIDAAKIHLFFQLQTKRTKKNNE